MTCKELVELMTSYLEGAMDVGTRALFDTHLEQCRGCRHYLEELRVAIRTVGRIEAGNLHPDFRGRLLEAFRTWR